jgi:V/A-type H+-transporting ATPase subunit I
MFFPEAMTEIELIVPAKELLSVTRLLADQGIFHQTDASYLNSKDGFESTDSIHEQVADYSVLERRIQASMKTLELEEGKPETSDTHSMLEVDTTRQMVDQIEQEVQQVNVKLADSRKRLEQLQGYLHQLEPIADIDLDIGFLQKSRYIFSILGVIPVNNLSRLQTSLARIPFVLLTLQKDRQDAIVWLAGTRHNSDILSRAARSAFLNPFDLPDVHQGTPAEVISSLNIAVQRLQAQIEEDHISLVEMRDKHRQQLHTLLWRVRVDRMLADAMAHYGKLRYTYLIVGWVPSSKLASLTKKIKNISENILLESTPTPRQGESRQDIPVALGNPGILSPFQQLVTTFAQPHYHELDPTFLIAITFPILYGAMFGDLGQGALLTIAGGIIASRKIRALRSLGSLGGLIVACGISAMIFGLLYGSIFGMENIIPALWIRPMENIMQILIISIGAGIILLCGGFLLNMFNGWVSRDWGRVFFGQNGLVGFLLYLSMIGLLVGFFVKGFPVPPSLFLVIAAITGLIVMFSDIFKHLIARRRPLVEGGLFAFLFQAAFELFETLIGFLSNTLSYVRVGAFAVAHVGLSLAIFILANLVGASNGVGYWIVVALGTLFIVGFEGLIIGIQTMRLEYYEFFSKFFTGGGLLFKPFTISPSTEK